jgi:hypothetical protein
MLGIEAEGADVDEGVISWGCGGVLEARSLRDADYFRESNNIFGNHL